MKVVVAKDHYSESFRDRYFQIDSSASAVSAESADSVDSVAAGDTDTTVHSPSHQRTSADVLSDTDTAGLQSLQTLLTAATHTAQTTSAQSPQPHTQNANSNNHNATS